MGLMSGLLSQVVHLPSQPGSLRSRLAVAGQDITRRLRGNKFHCSAETAATFFTLQDLIEFFDKYHAGHHQEALEVC